VSARPRAPAGLATRGVSAFVLALALVLALGRRDALGQTAPGAPAPRFVEVTAAGPPESLDAMARLLGELLERLAVTLRWVAQPRIVLDGVLVARAPTPGAVGAVWLDLSSREHVRIVLADAGGDRFLVRDLRLATGLDPVGREQVGHVVESAVAALLEGGTIGLSREAARSAAGVSAPAPAVVSAVPRAPAPVVHARPAPVRPPLRDDGSTGLRVGLGVAYEALVFAPEAGIPLLHGPGATLSVDEPSRAPASDRVAHAARPDPRGVRHDADRRAARGPRRAPRGRS